MANEESAGPFITEEWRSSIVLPPMPTEGIIAERLVLLAHYGADFNIWGGARRSRYWDALMERTKASTYAGPALSDWWQSMSSSLPCAPRNARERADLVFLMSHEPALPVLYYLRRNPDFLVMRVRVIAEQRRITYLEKQEGERDNKEQEVDGGFNE